MPLVRVTGVDADAFDISDMAKMNDQNHSRKTWHSRNNRTNPKSSLSPTDTDETPSMDSSSMVCSDRDGSGGVGGGGGRHSFASINSSQLSNSAGSGNNNARTFNLSANSNFDHYYDDPRNPFDGHKIPEEDEDNSAAAMEDCSLSVAENSLYRAHQQNIILSPQYQNNVSIRRTNSIRSQSTMNQQYRHRQASNSSSVHQEEDDMSSTSSIQTSSLRNIHKDSAGSSSAYATQLVSQLESQVAKLNFELATTKSSLDQLQLENRKLQDEKFEWHKNLRQLQDENDQLRIKIERMEKEKLMRTMEGTKGVARGRGRMSMDVSSNVVWGGSSVSGNTWVGDGNTITSYKQDMKPASSVQKLEVPFSATEREAAKSHRCRARRSSASSTGSLHSSFDDAERSQGRLSAADLSIGSIDLDSSGKESVDSTGDQKQPLTRPSLLGGLSLPGMTKKLQNNRGRQLEEKNTISQRNTSSGSATEDGSAVVESAVNAAENNDDVLGHIEEEYDDDDPFATWSENRGQNNNKKKWFQRGDGQKPQSFNTDADDEQQHTQGDNEDSIDDPFDTAKGGKKNEESDYISFAENSSHTSEDGGDDTESSTQQANRRGFRLPWQRNENR